MSKLKNIPLIEEMIERKYINVQKHPDADLWLYNYSKSAQVDHMWNEATLQCRGIIVDANGDVVARPFEKFYNYEELEGLGISVPNLPFDVFEKMDGSLGILYWIGDIPYLATRGSFKSDQSKHGTEILHTKYRSVWDRLDRSKTYLFEIIYPEDKHCIVYGPDVDDIFLLAVIDTETGLETDSIENYRDCLSVTKKYDGINDWTDIRERFDGANREGFVVRFSNGFRMKMKYEEYFKIHFIRSMLSKKLIAEHLADGNLAYIEETIGQLDEENQIYYRKLKDTVLSRYNEIESELNKVFRPHTDFDTMKEYAEWVKTMTGYSALIFSKDKGTDYSGHIWKMIKNEIREENRLNNESYEYDE